MPPNVSDDFKQQVYAYYDARGRHDLPWRSPNAAGDFEPYHILVSELMLQQTQVPRVIPKFREFRQAFPTLEALAKAELGAVIRVWSGLGYNRRAKFLWQAAQAIVANFDGQFPQTTAELVTLPGVGANTAGAILAYAFNQPVIFVETNIRTVFIHHFFGDHTDIADEVIIEQVAETLDQKHPREWYWALMDYGTFLKQTVGNLNRQSQSYAKQSAFDGSRRQIRGQVLRLLGERPRTLAQLKQIINDKRLTDVLIDLQAETLITRRRNSYHL